MGNNNLREMWWLHIYRKFELGLSITSVFLFAPMISTYVKMYTLLTAD